jgi:hypothetical protein
MTKLYCFCCDYKTNFRSNFNRHLKSAKHKENLINSNQTYEKDENDLICEPILNPNEPKRTQIEPKKNPKEPFLNPDSDKTIKKSYFCRFCNKEFSTNSHMNRHIRNNCKVKKEIELKEKSEDKKEIAELKHQISKLIDKVGNNTYHIENCGNSSKQTNNLNQTNNNLNIFGKENLEMVTDEVKKELIKGPFKMMPKLLEMIYFNEEYPENHTMKLVNKNKEVMKVHKEEGWKLVDKTDTIDYVLEDKNYEVDNYYDENTDEFSQFVKRTYKNFRRLFDNRDKELWKQIQRDVDLLLWNNM